jgi:hypothetical protein
MRQDALGTRGTDADGAARFPTHRPPTAAPWRLARVTSLPDVEEISDRHPAAHGRGRMDGP